MTVGVTIFHFISFFCHAGQKHKKWKVYFFILNSTKQHLYYFDNEKVRNKISVGF